MTPTQRVDVARLSELLDKATPGPWALDSAYPGNVYCDDATGSIVARVSGQGFEYAPRPSTERSANAELIAAAVNALPALLQQLAELDAALRTVRDEYQSMTRRWSDAEAKLAERDAAYVRLYEMKNDYCERFETAERAREEAHGLLRDVIAWRRTVPIEETPNRKDGGIFGRIAAFLAANGGGQG